MFQVRFRAHACLPLKAEGQIVLTDPWGADTVAISSCLAVRDAARWNELFSFRQAMSATSWTPMDHLNVAVKRADSALLGGALRRWRRRVGAAR